MRLHAPMPTRITLRRVGAKVGKKAVLPASMAELLELATIKLDLTSPARCIFSEQGDEYDADSMDLIGMDEVLYVSCGENVVPPEAPNVVGEAKAVIRTLQPGSRSRRYAQFDDASSADIEIATTNEAVELADITNPRVVDEPDTQGQNAKQPPLPLAATAARRWLPCRSLAMLLLGSCCAAVGWAVTTLTLTDKGSYEDSKTSRHASQTAVPPTSPSPASLPPSPLILGDGPLPPLALLPLPPSRSPSLLPPVPPPLPPLPLPSLSTLSPSPQPSPPPLYPLPPPPPSPRPPPLAPAPPPSPSPPPLLPAVKWWPSLAAGDTAVLQSRNEGTCAVVGGGHGLLGGSFGAEIDGADVVVRVNRLPRASGEDTADLGRRTDAYVIDKCSMVDSARNGIFGVQYNGGAVEACNLRTVPLRSDSSSCPFATLILRGNDARWEHGCSGEFQRNDAIRDAAARSAVHLGVETDLLLEAVFDLRSFHPPGSNKPTTGLHALVAVGLLCSHVRLYGFAGTRTVDGHGESGDHDIAAEHALLAELVAKGDRLELLAMSTKFRQAWAETNVTVVC